MIGKFVFAPVTIFAAITFSAPGFAGPDCTCRGNGKDIAEGQIVCLNLPSGAVLARCDRVLNNTAWKTIQKGCPLSSLQNASPVSFDDLQS